MKVIVILCTLVAGNLAASDQFQATYYPTDPQPINTTSLKIVNGQNADIGQFPYQISLQRRGIFGYSHICGGSIIGDRWILTAAHCVSGGQPSDYLVKSGLTFLDDGAPQSIGVEKIIVHHKYPGGSSVSPHDIALVYLNLNLIYDVYTRSIILPSPGQVSQGDAVLSGWGLTRSGGSIPNNLQWANLPIMDQHKCKRALDFWIRKNPLDKQLNICTGLNKPGQSACNGDSGGPLVQNEIVIGVVSWGLVPCGQKNTPSVYVKVSAYVDWIHEMTNGDI